MSALADRAHSVVKEENDLNAIDPVPFCCTQWQFFKKMQVFKALFSTVTVIYCSRGGSACLFALSVSVLIESSGCRLQGHGRSRQLHVSCS